MKRAIVLIIIACIFLSGCVSGDGGDSGTDWELAVEGEVDSSFTITFDELLELESETIEATIEKTTGTTETNEWTGVPIEYFIERAGLNENVDRVILEAFDGYTVTLEMDELEDGLIAYEMDGERLQESEPLRMVLPHKWGPAWMRGLTKLTFTTTVGKLQIVGDVKAPLLLAPGDLETFEHSTVTFDGTDYYGVTLTQLFDQARYILDSTNVVYYCSSGTLDVPIENVLDNDLVIVFVEGDSFGLLAFTDEGSQVLTDVYKIEVTTVT
ncbi:MAG TPA: molybdopterin-dependent oxidoreductase [Candidatus Methanofastidiosa archaeon]|nr:molybdopterin-dependent oxidoreductase [Candidatus Methanofastidiosa archaeon]